MSETRCQASFFGAHRFEARYSEHSEVPANGVKLSYATPELVKSFKTTSRKYEGDICVRCGETRKP